jgi:hypothetical protein
VLPAPSANAAGFDLRWNACGADGGVANQSFACDTDDGTHTMVASFMLDQPISGMFLFEAVLDLIVAGDQPVPAWWDNNDCRMFAISADANYDPSSVNCDDWSGGTGAAVMSGYHSGGTIAPGDTASHRRMTLIGGVNPPGVALAADQEYFLFNVVVTHSSTLDPDACAGCDVPVCIVLNSIRFANVSAQTLTTLTTALSAGSNFATWQGGSGANCMAVPAKRTTWGAVKSLYR